MSHPWCQFPIHIMDFEGSPEYGIIEYGVVTLLDGAITNYYTSICKAEADIDQRETWCHGLKRQDTANSAPFGESWQLFSGLRQTGPFAAHHASVENRLLKRYWPYTKASIDFSNPSKKTTNWGPWLDTCALYQNLMPQLSEHSLGFLIREFQLQAHLDSMAQSICPAGRQKYHCALYDALAATLLLIYLNQSKDISDASLEWLIAQSQGKQEKRQDNMQRKLF